ncbi:baseplate J/gp47 family protein [Mycolicibacterium psychrotolerans]|uniref:Putative baseplate assembly protein n=1 Tax=Mycolicibacterium psychrotolerans TaxID=216929 RepID=A0A7I7MDT1_9MYCO|nr:baseplate J/gp47 family protein [Mycolicibacterium psychrotolerans]BBX69960.1 putative baseplate assembly protein [Mycolicibacterium psychrotolerans]
MNGISGPGTCSCCTGLTVRTPGVVENRPGLAEVRYRSGVHGDFLASMLARLSSDGQPALAGLRTRDGDDLTIALLDAWAVACDVLTFYTERLANESYLRTATERTSLQELGKLVAYPLSPGVAAATWLAFALERPPALPALDPPDPGQVPPEVPDAVILPVGLRVQSVPGPGEQAQTFETVEQIEARPEWNALPVVRTHQYLPALGRTDAWLDGVGLNVAKGDAILFAEDDPINDPWDVQLLTEVAIDAARMRTHVVWESALGSYPPPNEPAAFVLRKRLAVFGHNAPVFRAMNATFRAGYQVAAGIPVDLNAPQWPNFVAVTTDIAGNTVVDLDGPHPDVVRGSWLVLSQDGTGFYRGLYEVVQRAELSRAEFGISGKVTRLTLAGTAHAFGTPREVTVMAVADPLTVVEAPDDTAVGGPVVVVDGDAAEMSADRTVVLAGTAADGTAQSEVITIKTATRNPDGRTTLTLRSALTKSYVRATAVVFGNVAHAGHGQTITQILGSGDARRPFQTFAVQQGPLTFVPDDSPSGATSTLRVEVDGVCWSELATTFGSAPPDRVFVTREEPGGSRSVVFGDGQRGARPATGSNNVRATYRIGIGTGGNLRVGQLSQALDRPLGLKGVSNPVEATGGVDPQQESDARLSIPVGVRTLGRAVSLQDFADFALAFTGIGKAAATVLSLRGVRTVVVTIADKDGFAPPDTTVARLRDSLRGQSDPHVRAVVLPVVKVDLRLALTVRTDPLRESAAVLSAVAAALRTVYGHSAVNVGAPVHQSAVIATAAAVPGVVGVDLDRLYRAGDAPSLQQRVLAMAAHDQGDEPVAAELLGLPADGFDWLWEMT